MRLGAAVPRSDRSAPEQNTVPLPVSTTAAHVGVTGRVTQRLLQLRQQARRQGIAVGGRIERQRPDAVVVLHADQHVRHGCAV